PGAPQEPRTGGSDARRSARGDPGEPRSPAASFSAGRLRWTAPHHAPSVAPAPASARDGVEIAGTVVRIAYVSCDRGISAAGSNGAAPHIRELVNALVDRGVEVKLLAARTTSACAAEALACEVIDVDSESLLHQLRRRTARVEGATSAPGTRASEIHSL